MNGTASDHADTVQLSTPAPAPRSSTRQSLSSASVSATAAPMAACREYIRCRAGAKCKVKGGQTAWCTVLVPLLLFLIVQQQESWCQGKLPYLPCALAHGVSQHIELAARHADVRLHRHVVVRVLHVVVVFGLPTYATLIRG